MIFRRIGSKKGCLAIAFGCVVALVIVVAADFIFGLAMAGKIRRPFYRLDAARDLALEPGVSVNNPVEAFTADGVEVPTGKSYRIRINNLGLRGPETTMQPPVGKIRIVCMGDSSTFGWGVEEESAWPRKMESILNGTSGVRYEVQNLGVFSYTSHNGLIYFRDFGLNLSPQIAIISFGTNDLRGAGNRAWPFSSGSDKDVMPLDGKSSTGRIVKVWFLDHFAMPVLDSNFATYLRYRMAARQRKALQEKKQTSSSNDAIAQALTAKSRVSLDDYAANLRTMKSLADARGCKTIFLAIGLNAEYFERMKTVALETGTPILVDEDIYKAGLSRINDAAYSTEREWSLNVFGEKLRENNWISWFRLDAVHPTPLGHRLIAEELARVIAEKR